MTTRCLVVDMFLARIILGSGLMRLGSAFTSIPCWGNVTLTLNNKVGVVVGFREYANNSLNVWADSGLYNITTTNESSTLSPTLRQVPLQPQVQVQHQLRLHLQPQVHVHYKPLLPPSPILRKITCIQHKQWR